MINGNRFLVPGDGARLVAGGSFQMVGDVEVFEAIALFVWRMLEGGESESEVFLGGFRFEIELGDRDFRWLEKAANEVEGFRKRGGIFGWRGGGGICRRRLWGIEIEMDHEICDLNFFEFF